MKTVESLVMRKLIIGSLMAALALPSAVWATPYKMDKAHAHLVFAVDHLGFSVVRGRFAEFDAEIDFDPDDPEAATINLKIETDSVTSFSNTRDKAIVSKSLLHADKHPMITFVSTEVELLDGNDAMVTGDLTIRGVTREESFKATMRRAGVNPLTMRDTVGFAVEGKIDRRDYEMTWGVGAIGAIVDFNFDLEAYIEE